MVSSSRPPPPVREGEVEPVLAVLPVLLQPSSSDFSSVEMTILAQFALIDPDLFTLVTHLKVKVNGP